MHIQSQVQSPQEGVVVVNNPWRFTYYISSFQLVAPPPLLRGPSEGRLLDHVGTESAPSLLWHPVQELGATAEGVDEGRDDGMNIGRLKGH